MWTFIFIPVTLLVSAAVLAENNDIIKVTVRQMYTELKNQEYPQVYEGNGVQTWKFESEQDSKLVIKCEDFRFSMSDNCGLVRLEIVDGENTENYCGHHDALKIMSKGNVLTVRLTGDTNGQAVFSCMVKSTKAPEPKEIEVIMNEVYTFATPRNPTPYLDKVWHLKAPQGHQVDLECSISLIGNDPCHDEVLTVDVGDGPKEYCGFKKELLFSKINEATVRLELDKFGQGKIFCNGQAVIKEEVKIDDIMKETKRYIDSSEHGRGQGRKNTTCPCGWANKSKRRIINGNEAEANEFPWMVAVNVDFEEGTGTCGGSIVTHRHVLTAAHCVVNLGKDMQPVHVDTIEVIVGGHSFGFWPIWKSHTVHSVSQLFVRQEFSFWNIHDFAVIVVSKPIEFTQKVGPICLSPTSLNTANEQLTIMGWGKTERETSSTVLLKAKTSIVNKRFCKKNPWEVCTRADASATCSGDSGGPLAWLDPETNRYTQVSLVSYGHVDCVSSPTVSTDVSYYYNWIQQIIKNTHPKEALCTRA